MDVPKRQNKRSLLNALNRQLPDCNKLKSLQEWLDAAEKLGPSVANALEGMYCGREGRIHEQINGLDHDVWLTMGWCTVSDTPRVEYAYFS